VLEKILTIYGKKCQSPVGSNGRKAGQLPPSFQQLRAGLAEERLGYPMTLASPLFPETVLQRCTEQGVTLAPQLQREAVCIKVFLGMYRYMIRQTG
jgi:hypothetical protein